MRRLSPLEIWFVRHSRETRAAREKACERPRWRAKRTLSTALRSRMVDAAASILKRGEPTVFAFEGAIRATIRARLCLKGWDWQDADFAAAGVVGAAMNVIGAQRPTWQEGQGDWVNDAGAKVDRATCAHCGRRLPEEKWKFCSTRCMASYHRNITYHQERLEREATERFNAAVA